MAQVQKQFEVVGDLVLSGASVREIFEPLGVKPPVRAITIPGGTVLSGENVTIPSQTLNLNGSELTLSDGNTIDLANALPELDIQSLTLQDEILTISRGNSIDLSEHKQTLTLSGDSLVISNGNTVDLSPMKQDLSVAGTELSISDGNTVDLGFLSEELDDQTLSLSGTTLTISNGNAVDLATMQQDLSLDGTDLSISDGNTVDLSPMNQSLTFTGTDLSISDGNTVDLSYLAEELDNQQLTLSGNNLTISNLIEVGANIGSVTTTFLLIDKKLTATAIEGNTYSKNYLDVNIYINNLTQRCKTVVSLIGNSTKDVFFVTFQGESGNSMVFDTLNKSLIERYSKKMNLNIKNIEKRKVSTLTELDEIPVINRRTLIWLDIEGYEYSVLNGIQELTTKPIIVFEINPALISSTQKSPNLFIKNFEDLFINNSYSNAILLVKRSKNFEVRSGFLNDICDEISYSNAHGDILIY
mgnify:CR=1 FL=1